MHHQRQSRTGFHDLFDAVKRQLRLVLEFESPVARSDRDGEAVDAGLFREIRRLFRIGQEFLHVLLIFLGVQSDNVFFDAAEHAQVPPPRPRRRHGPSSRHRR